MGLELNSYMRVNDARIFLLGEPFLKRKKRKNTSWELIKCSTFSPSLLVTDSVYYSSRLTAYSLIYTFFLFFVFA